MTTKTRTTGRGRAIGFFLFVIAATPAAHAEPTATAEFTSGDRRVSLVELYTSEGCSSCPPADRWFTGLVNNDGLWRDFVPVALHVDYWDYIGWPDRFADPAYSARQRQYANESTRPVIYTPGMFVDGEEWLGWRRGKSPTGRRDSAGVLTVRVFDEIIEVRYVADESQGGRLAVHVGLMGMNLETEVAAGENRGRRLRHDFVLLNLDRETLRGDEDGRTAVARLPYTDTIPSATALVAWVSDGRSQAPIQAVGGYLPDHRGEPR